MRTTARPLRAAVTVVALVGASTMSLVVDVPRAVAQDPPPGGFHSGLYVPIDELPLGDPGDAVVTANGNLALTWADSDFGGTVVEGELESFDAGLDLRGALTLELSAATGGDLGGEFPIATVPVGVIDAGPFQVIPYVGVVVRLDGHADAGAQMSVVAPFDVGAAFASADARRASPTTPPSFEPELGPPDLANAVAFDGTVELGLSLTFMVSIEGVPVGGPVLDASLGLALHVDLADSPWWDLDGIAALRVGWSRPDLAGLPQPPRDLRALFPPRRFDIAEAPDAAPFADGATRWSRAFDSFHDDDLGAVIPVGEDLVVVEQSGTPWMSTLDGFGNPRWQQNDTEPMPGTALARTDDGDLLVAGVHSSGDLRVERYTADGVPLWAKVVEVDDVDGGVYRGIVPIDGGAIFVGNVTHSSGGPRRTILIALDDDGGLLWATEIDTGLGSDSALISDVEVAPNGDLLVVGSVVYEDAARTIVGRNALVLRLHPDGTPVSAYAVGGPLGEGANAIAVHDDGTYAVSGQGAGELGDEPSLVSAFGADDSLQWTASYADRVDAGYAMATGIAVADGGGYVVSGTTGMTGQDGWLIRIDPTGMPLWAKTYQGASADELTGVVAMPVGFAAYGQTHTTNVLGNGFDDLWLLRTSVDGSVPFDPASGFDTVNDAVQWHPSGVHTQHALAPSNLATVVTVVDADFGATPAAATNFPLT